MSIFDFEKLLKKKGNSGRIAKDRLNVVLIHDRMSCSNEMLMLIKSEIIKSISKYIELNPEDLDIALDVNDSAHILSASIPINKIKNKPTC